MLLRGCKYGSLGVGEKNKGGERVTYALFATEFALSIEYSKALQLVSYCLHESRKREIGPNSQIGILTCRRRHVKEVNSYTIINGGTVAAQRRVLD